MWNDDFRKPINKLFHTLDKIYDDLFEPWSSNSNKGVHPQLLPYTYKVLASLLHVSHEREPQAIKKIRIQQKRYPSKNEFDIANQQEITNCNQKSAYIGESEEISLELDFFNRNYFPRKFQTGTDDDMIDREMFGLKIQNVYKTKVANLYRWIMDSGIWERLRVEILVRRNKLRKSAKDKENVKMRLDGVSSLEGGLVTLFILCGALISLAVIEFCFECRRIIWETLKNGYKRVLKALKILRQNLIKIYDRVLKMLTRKRKGVKFRSRRKIHVEIGMIEVKPK
jgi:hypothetical protein